MTTTIQITDRQFTEAIRAAVAERGPDFVYDRNKPGWGYVGDRNTGKPGCRYVTTEAAEEGVQAGCLIGVTLHKVGLSLNTLAVYENDPATVILQALDVGITDEARFAAGSAQRVQDPGGTWGAALARYETVMKLPVTYPGHADNGF